MRSAISAQVTKALSLGQLQSAVACDEEDDDVIYAFLIWHEVTKNIAAIDFAYTKNFCRRLGFQTSLLKALDPYSVKVLTFYAPCFSLKEYAKDGLQFGEALPKKGLVIDPFFYERLSPSDDMKGPL